jgi:hypothetical protein
VLKLLRERWSGPTGKLDAALAAAASATEKKRASDRARAGKHDTLAKPGPKRKAAILKAIGKKIEKRHEELSALATGVLARPDVVADPAWGDFVRALTQLTASYDRADDDEDESNTMEIIADERLSTIDIVLRLLALPEAIARDDWAELVRFVCDEKRARLGAWSFGDEEIARLFAEPAAREHAAVRSLKEVARRAFPHASL